MKIESVSIIIPYYNLGLYLAEAIESIESQTVKPSEIIICNDGSDDPHSLEVLDQYREKLIVIDKENTGLANTRNKAIEISKSKYIICLDADDLLKPNYIERCLKEFELYPEVGFVTTWVRTFENSSHVWKTSSHNPELLLRENCVHVASMFKKICWEEVGGYNENMPGYQDWNFWLNIVGKGYRWSCIEKELFLYRVRKSSMITNSDGVRPQILEMIIKSNFSLYKEYLVRVLIGMDVDKVMLRERIEELESYLDLLEQRTEGFRSDIRDLQREKAELKRKTSEINKRLSFRILNKIFRYT